MWRCRCTSRRGRFHAISAPRRWRAGEARRSCAGTRGTARGPVTRRTSGSAACDRCTTGTCRGTPRRRRCTGCRRISRFSAGSWLSTRKTCRLGSSSSRGMLRNVCFAWRSRVRCSGCRGRLRDVQSWRRSTAAGSTFRSGSWARCWDWAPGASRPTPSPRARLYRLTFPSRGFQMVEWCTARRRCRPRRRPRGRSCTRRGTTAPRYITRHRFSAGTVCA